MNHLQHYNLLAAEKSDGFFHMFEVDSGIETRAEGALVGDTEDRHGESVYYAAA